jgi:hypothetical protein
MQFEMYGADSLNFVEFNTTGDFEAFQRCDKDSLYMDTDLFNLFSDCFEKSNKLYEYFGPTRYNSRNTVVLINELKANCKVFEQINDYKSFVSFIDDKFLGAEFFTELEKVDKDWHSNWEQYKVKLIDINQQLINLINCCINEERILWVIGY